MEKVQEHKDQRPFREHVKELRQAFMTSLFYILAGSALGYALYKPIFALLIKPYNNQLYFTTPAGAFNAIFKVSILFGLIIAIPFIVHRIFKFVSPAFPKRIHFFTVRLLFLSFMLAVAGVSYGYFISLPTTIHFLTNVGPANVKPLIEVSSYLNFVFHYLLGLAIVFQFPLILLIINKVTPLRPSGLMRYQRHVIAGSVILAAIITPTVDPVNQMIMTVPMIALYQLGVVFVWLANRNRVELVGNRRPSNVEPVAISLIPVNFGHTELAALPAPMIVEKPAVIEPQITQVQTAPEQVVVRVVKEAKPRLLPKLQGYSPGRVVVDILPPMASA